jgi:hypothetical protein
MAVDWLLILVAGFAGSVHCVGMCGGFACAIGRDTRGRAATVRRHLLYNLGRVTSYAFIGAACGTLGLVLVGHDGGGAGASAAQRVLALMSGALMVLIGLQFLGVLAHGPARLGEVTERLARALRGALNVPGPAMPLAFGVLNGLLPCPLVYAFAAQAAASGGPAAGVSLMLLFGLGTFPAMLLSGWAAGGVRRVAASGWQAAAFRSGRAVVGRRAGGASAAALPRDWRVTGVRLAGAFIVALGLITFARGVLPMLAPHVH